MAFLTRPSLAATWVCCALSMATQSLAQDGQIEPPKTPDSSVVYTLSERPTGLSDDPEFQVFVGPSGQCCTNKSPISGHYSFEELKVTFTPAFEFLEGQTYTVQTRHGALSEFKITPKVAQPRPEVLAIYPGGGQIPENTLRFYIEFSTPMMPHRAEDFIALVDDTGAVDDAAFMMFKQEIWNEDRTRLTLLMDPGRIKRGVAQNMTLGPAIEETRRYALVVRAGWPGATGPHVASRYENSFVVSPALRARPSLNDWDLSLPTIGTRSRLAIAFDRPFDAVQTSHNIRIINAKGQGVTGDITLDASQTYWTFAPDKPWTSGTFEIVIDAHLEDVAGNNFRDTLDHPVGAVTREVDQLWIPFQPMKSGG